MHGRPLGQCKNGPDFEGGRFAWSVSGTRRKSFATKHQELQIMQ